MAELLLPEDAENNTYKNLKTSVSTKTDLNVPEKGISSKIEFSTLTTAPLYQTDIIKQNLIDEIQINENEQKNLQISPTTITSIKLFQPPSVSPFKINQYLTNETTNSDLYKIDNSTNNGLYLFNSTLQQKNNFNSFNEVPTSLLNSTNSNSYFNIDTINLTNSVAMSYNCFNNANVHFQVPSTVSPSSSLLSLSTNSPFSSSASSPSVITGNATAAAAAAAALCFTRNNGFTFNDSYDSVNSSIQTIYENNSQRKASIDSNIIAPTPIYATSLMSNLIKEQQNPLFRK